MLRLLSSGVLGLGVLPKQVTFRVRVHLFTFPLHSHSPVMILVDQAEFILLPLLDRVVPLIVSTLWVESFVVISHLNCGLVKISVPLEQMWQRLL